MNRGSNFLGDSFSNRVRAVRAPIQFRRESQYQHLKRWFFFKKRPIHFYINSTSVTRPVKQNQLIFPALKSRSHFLPQSTVSHRSNSSSEANSSYCHTSDAWFLWLRSLSLCIVYYLLLIIRSLEGNIIISCRMSSLIWLGSRMRYRSKNATLVTREKNLNL